MADQITVTTPDFTGVVDQRFFIRPLGGPQHPQSYLDRFPEEVYNKGIDSHLVKFAYAILGPAGIGWLRKNYLEARLKLEDYGIETFDLDRFYGDPLAFGRILEEVYDEDPGGLIPHDKWMEIKAKDAKYRNRAIDFLNAARAGNTPLGMRLAARSGLGHEVEIVENYRYIYDQLSDDPVGIPYQGFTTSTREIIVIPRRELPQNEIQVVTISGTPTGGTFSLFFPVGPESTHQTLPIAYNAIRSGGVFTGTSWTSVQEALEAIPSIGVGQVLVTGGPLPGTPIEILFTGELSNRDVPTLIVSNNVTGGTTPTIAITTKRSGIDQTDEVVALSPRDQRYLRDAIGRLKPMTAVVTFNKGRGLRSQQVWNSIYSANTYHEVVRYATGQSGIPWPAIDDNNWIEASVEHRAPRAFDDLQQHYRGFHNIASILAYNGGALDDVDYLTDNWPTIAPNYADNHVGPFSQYQQFLFPVLNQVRADTFQHLPEHAPADYAEPLTITSTTRAEKPVPLINGIYPASYQTLAGVPEVRYKDEQFWASVERTTGDSYLEIDFGAVRPVNYLYFEITSKPFDITVDYDILDQGPQRRWQSVTLDNSAQSVTAIGYDVRSTNPWHRSEIWFTNSLDDMIFTRYLRIKFGRRNDASSPFLASDGTTVYPFSVEIRNLRAARNVS